MKFSKYFLWFAVVMGVYFPDLALASRYANGLEGIRAATVPPPGIYYRLYNFAYLTDTVYDDSGSKVDMGFDLSSYAMAHRGIWVSEREILGGQYFADIVVPIVKTDLDIDQLSISDDDSGLGDIFIEPFGLAWHRDGFDAAVAFGIFLDNADFDPQQPVTLGSGYKTAMLTAGMTKYFGRQNAASFSLLARYETHSEQDKTDITFGDDFHFEFGLGYRLSETVDAGLSGYADWQVSSDKGTEEDQNKDRIYALGPEIGAFFPKGNFLLSLRTLREFGAKDRPEGIVATLTVTKIF